MASEVERVVLQYENVEFVKAEGKPNPITGQHVEVTVQAKNGVLIEKMQLKEFMRMKLPKHMEPKRINLSTINIGHRFKRI